MAADIEHDDGSAWELIIAFPDSSPSFVHGFEAGQLWQRMIYGQEAEIEATCHAENRELVRRMASAQGWEVEIEPASIEGWDTVRLTKAKPAPDHSNPHGLRVVD